MQPFRRRQVERPERVIDIAGIEAWVARHDRVCFAPHRFAAQRPCPLIVGHVLERLTVSRHRPDDATDDQRLQD
jgi:hypothetical protein